MRFKCASTLVAVLFSISLFSQTMEFTPYVYSSNGMEFENDSIYFSMTIGQPIFETYTLSDFALTQGFQQPSGEIPDTVVAYSIEYHECDQLYYIMVDTAMICSQDAPIFFWNNQPGDSLFVSAGGPVVLRIETTSGCVWEQMIDLLSEEILTIECPLIFYSLITPNSDGENDAWIIENIDQGEFASNKVVIMNRWGNEVWEAENYDNDNVLWTGISNKGFSLPDGTYFYSVDTHNLQFRGYVELQR
jgi:gliding motility-associated-like protein